MTRALVWKELREQWIIWLTIALVAGAGVTGLYTLVAAQSDRATLAIEALWLVAWGYGMMCGALLLAGEAEEGTQTFLDALPVSRQRLWNIKASTGLGLLLAQIVAFLVIAQACRLQGYTPPRTTTDMLLILLAGGVGYAWGLFSGALSASVLGAIGWAILLQTLTGIAGYLLVDLPVRFLFSGVLPQSMPPVWLLATVGAALGAANYSRALYCRDDRSREAFALAREQRRAPYGLGVLFWLAWRQARGLIIGMAVLALFGIVGMALLRVIAWPLLTLFIGVLCGVAAFGDEQQSGSFRFAGDQRIPPGRLWLVKVLVYFAVGLAAAAFAAAGVAVILAIRAATTARIDLQRFEQALPASAISTPLSEPFVSLTIWLICGFAFGVLFGLLFRKPLVATVIAASVALPVVAMWVPSLMVSGRLHAWQVWGVPAIVILATRALVWPRAADQPWSVRTVLAPTGCLAAAGLWLAAALWYRTVEIAIPPDSIDVAAFEASLPSLEENEGGRLSALGLRRLFELERGVDSNVSSIAAQRPLDGIAPRTFASLVSQAGTAAQRGYPENDEPLGAFLDRVFADNWAGNLAEAAEHPTGVMLDPRSTTSHTLTPELLAAPQAFVLLVARGLQQQQHQKPDVFVRNLRIALALSRNMRHRTTLLSVRLGEQVETTVLRGVYRWLERLGSRADLMRDALEVLKQHEDSPATDWQEIRKAELLVALNAFSDPENLVDGSDNVRHVLGVVADQGFLQFIVQVPWERIRVARLLDALGSTDAATRRSAEDYSPLLVRISAPRFIRELAPDKNQESVGRALLRHAALRAALLQVALRLYQAENSHPASNLADLVPRYLPAVPADPFDGLPFRYRLSRGEALEWPADDLSGGDPGASMQFGRTQRQVPAGWGILWSVGEDRHDDGGRTQVSAAWDRTLPGEDRIYLVPPPVEPR